MFDVTTVAGDFTSFIFSCAEGGPMPNVVLQDSE